MNTIQIQSHPKALPLWVNTNKKWIAGLFIFFVVSLLYLTTNRYSFLQPYQLRWTELDKKIPLLPWTVWIYLSGFPFLIVALWLNRCVVSLNKHLYSLFFLCFSSNLIFFFFPTSLPRDQIQPKNTSETVLSWIHWIDLPKNCCPSLHVSIAILVALGFLDDKKEHFPWIFAWALLVAGSTLTTHQHSIWDVLGGLTLGISIFFIFHRWMPYRWRTAFFYLPAEENRSQSYRK